MSDPITMAECRHFQILHVAPVSLAMDQPGFVEAVYRVSKSVFMRVTDASHRWFDASFSQTFGVANEQIQPVAATLCSRRCR